MSAKNGRSGARGEGALTGGRVGETGFCAIRDGAGLARGIEGVALLIEVISVTTSDRIKLKRPVGWSSLREEAFISSSGSRTSTSTSSRRLSI